MFQKLLLLAWLPYMIRRPSRLTELVCDASTRNIEVLSPIITMSFTIYFLSPQKTKDASCDKPPVAPDSTSSATSADEDESDIESVASNAGSRTAYGSNEPQNEYVVNGESQTTPRWMYFLSPDVVTILSSLMMHDGPFLIFRLFLLGVYHVTSEIHLFFTAKNALTVTIMLYRLYHLVHVSQVACSSDDQEEQDCRRNSNNPPA